MKTAKTPATTALHTTAFRMVIAIFPNLAKYKIPGAFQVEEYEDKVQCKGNAKAKRRKQKARSDK